MTSESAKRDAEKSPAPTASENIEMSPLIIFLGIAALIIGIGSGIVMSSATFFK